METIIEIVKMVIGLIAVLGYSESRASRHTNMIQNGMWIGHGKTHEGKEIIFASILCLGFVSWYGLFLIVVLGTSFNLWLNKKRGKKYNHLGIEDNGGVGPEDAWIDVFEYKYLYPFQTEARFLLAMFLLMMHLIITFN